MSNESEIGKAFGTLRMDVLYSIKPYMKRESVHIRIFTLGS